MIQDKKRRPPPPLAMGRNDPLGDWMFLLAVATPPTIILIYLGWLLVQSIFK